MIKHRRIGVIGDDGKWRVMPWQAFRNAFPDAEPPDPVACERPDRKNLQYVWEPEEGFKP